MIRGGEATEYEVRWGGCGLREAPKMRGKWDVWYASYVFRSKRTTDGRLLTAVCDFSRYSARHSCRISRIAGNHFMFACDVNPVYRVPARHNQSNFGIALQGGGP